MGRNQIKNIFKQAYSSEITGESWEISSVENDVSVVANGSYKGKSLNDLINEFPEAILGTKVYQQFGKQFPLLFKYLDACDDLSIQVHPDDELAKMRHNSFGKTEMWYVMQAETDARIIFGFKEKSNSEAYLQNLKNKSLLDLLDINRKKTFSDQRSNNALYFFFICLLILPHHLNSSNGKFFGVVYKSP